MPQSIFPLPLLAEDTPPPTSAPDPPISVVVRYGYQKMVAELPYEAKDRPGCGAKLVIRSNRGMEVAEALTTACPNSGCGKSISRKQMLEYIEASGGKNYPFSNQGKILRPATAEDILEQRRLDARKPEMLRTAKATAGQLDLPMRLVDAELLLGGERIVFYYTSEQWVDFRELVRRLAAEYQTRIEMHQVNAREEARLVADYERCGQHCCCKQFLKVLKPVSMRSAKVQKATLDPTKISGRCGRLMCCLRYEDETYETLRKRLPYKQTRMMTEAGVGTVIETQILTQLVLIRLDSNSTLTAYPVESVRALSKEEQGQYPPPKPPEQRPVHERSHAAPVNGYNKPKDAKGAEGAPPASVAEDQVPPEVGQTPPEGAPDSRAAQASAPAGGKRRRRRRGRRRGGRGEGPGGGAAPGPGSN